MINFGHFDHDFILEFFFGQKNMRGNTLKLYDFLENRKFIYKSWRYSQISVISDPTGRWCWHNFESILAVLTKILYSDFFSVKKFWEEIHSSLIIFWKIEKSFINHGDIFKLRWFLSLTGLENLMWDPPKSGISMVFGSLKNWE